MTQLWQDIRRLGRDDPFRAIPAVLCVFVGWAVTLSPAVAAVFVTAQFGPGFAGLIPLFVGLLFVEPLRRRRLWRTVLDRQLAKLDRECIVRLVFHVSSRDISRAHVLLRTAGFDDTELITVDRADANGDGLTAHMTATHHGPGHYEPWRERLDVALTSAGVRYVFIAADYSS